MQRSKALSSPSSLWWYRPIESEQAVGPLERHSLEALIKEGTIDRACLIREGESGAWVVASTQEAFSPLFKTILDLPVASPSHRFFARLFDIWSLSVLVAIPIGYLLSLYSATWVNFIEIPGADKLATPLFLPIILCAEAVIFGWLGTTPGKWLMGIRVVDYRGRPLTTITYLKRNFRVWFSGLALGIPIFSLATMYYQWNKLTSRGSSSYDFELKTQVRMTGTSAPKVLTFICVAVGFVFLAGWIQTINRDFDNERAQALDRPSYDWTNPISKESIRIAGQWSLIETKDTAGNPLYTFNDFSGRAAVILAYEKPTGYSLETYVGALRKSTAAFFSLNDSGDFTFDTNTPVWIAYGRGVEDSSVDVRIEVRQYDDIYWRLIIVQSPPKAATDAKVESFRLQLLSTLRNSLL